jgi:predicted RNA-binding protein YlxR (DUF448 family)
MLARIDVTDTDSDTDSGPRKAAAATVRLCVVTREVRPIDDMIRFVVGPDRAVVPDLKRKLPGRGVWVTARRDVVAAAVKRGAFARALRTDAKAAPDLPDTVERLMERALLDALAIARKARQVVTGHAKVEAAAEDGAAVAVLHGSDAGPEGVRQIMAAIRRGSAANAANVVVIPALTSAQLDLAFARPNVVHAALLAGRASDTVIARWRSLAGFRQAEPAGDDEIQRKQEAPTTGTE